ATADPPPERDPPRRARAALRRARPLPRCRQRPAPLLFEGDARPRARRARHRQSRPTQYAGRLGRRPDRRARPRGRRELPGPRPSQRRALRLAGQTEFRDARPGRTAGARLSLEPPAPAVRLGLSERRADPAPAAAGDRAARTSAVDPAGVDPAGPGRAARLDAAATRRVGGMVRGTHRAFAGGSSARRRRLPRAVLALLLPL